jgi:formate-dependent nitrite reductase cytochrome c552 subunit
MAQIFHRSTNTIAKVTIFGAALILCGLGYVGYEVSQSAYYTNIHVERPQPVPFSHKHHVTDAGIDCRYCHTTAEKSSYAGMPTTHICMSCHSKLWLSSPTLEPVRASYANDVSLAWTRVNAEPDFVYFDHSIHVNKGMGCTTCHGPIGQMPLTYRNQTLYMRWCIDCHNKPERFVRPRPEVFNANYRPPADQAALGRKLVAEYQIKSPRLITACTTCHR